MRRLVTTLVLLLVVFVAGMATLVVLINPNDFKQDLIDKVANESGYTLTIEGRLRWHVWPKLSVLGAAITLRAPETKMPLLIANDVRVDVALLPLLSHHLAINQVVLRNAILQMVPDSLAKLQSGQVIATNLAENPHNLPPISHFHLNELALIDSLVVWQDPRGNQVNFRETNIKLSQTSPQQGSFAFSSRINRNQQQLNLRLQGNFDARRYLDGIALLIEKGAYRYVGLTNPAAGISGTLVFNGLFSPNDLGFKVGEIHLTANGNAFNGTLNGNLANEPVIKANLHAQRLDMDALLGKTLSETPTVNSGSTAVSLEGVSQFDDPWLANTTINLELAADEVFWNSLSAKQLKLHSQLVNKQLDLSSLSGQIEQGKFSLTGNINFQAKPLTISLAPQLSNFPLNQLLTFIHLPQAFNGHLDLTGNITSEGAGITMLQRNLQGLVQVKLSGYGAKQLDLTTIVANAVMRNSDLVKPLAKPVEMPPLAGTLKFTPGEVKIVLLAGENESMQLSCHGVVDLTSRKLDVLLGVLMKRWQGDPRLVKLLSTQRVPLRLYGDWNDLHYQMPINEILKTDLQQDLKKRLDHWLEKNSASINNLTAHGAN